jgi:AbrB family looped-hinge helix DNA binding protein
MPTYIVAIDSRGRFTLPREVRDALGLKPGDPYTLVVQDDGSVALSKLEATDAESAVKRTLEPKS